MAYTTTTLADLKVLMAARWDNVRFWTEEEARLAINEALRDWNLLTGRWRRRAIVDTLAGNPAIPLPATMTYGMRIRLSTGAPLHPTSLTELDLMRPTWRNETTASGGSVPPAPLLWTPRDLSTIEIWPHTAGIVIGLVLVDGVSDTPVLVQDGDFVDLGEEIVDYVVDMALHNAAFKLAGPKWRATLKYFDAFIQAAAEENSLLKTNQAFRRWAGLDRRRDLQPTTGAPTQFDGLANAGSAGISQEEPG